MPDRPNILLICTDQQRYDTLGAYGNTHVSTGALDQLARDGTVFERCYTTSTVCAPARASMMTGVLPHAHGLWANGVALPSGQPVFTGLLAEHGYRTGLVGKMHLAACFGGRTEPPYDDSFSSYEWAHDPAHRSPDNAYHSWLRQEFPDLWADPPGDGSFDSGPYDDLPAEAHYSTWVASRAVDFIAEAPADRPFFLWANFFDPHHPFVAPEEYRGRYAEMTLPGPIRPNIPSDDKPAVQLETSRQSCAGALPGFLDYTEAEIAEIVARYHAMIDLIDDQVARILGALDARGATGETLVIFTSDHGEMLGDHGQLLKGPLFYEGATHVPLILRWPGRVAPGIRSPGVVSLLDLPTTILSAAGVRPPARMQGTDLVAGAGPGFAVCEYRDSGHPLDPPVHATMLVTERHKLVVYHGPPASPRRPAGELYDLRDDPDELTNRFSDAAWAGPRAELTGRLLDALVAAEDRSAPRDAVW